jgi:hypothetical protein
MTSATVKLPPLNLARVYARNEREAARADRDYEPVPFAPRFVPQHWLAMVAAPSREKRKSRELVREQPRDSRDGPPSVSGGRTARKSVEPELGVDSVVSIRSSKEFLTG